MDMMNQNTGKYLIIAGVVTLLIGITVYFFHDKFGWVGRLPGDIRIENEHSKLYIPFATMILFSILLNVLIYVIKKIS